MSTYQNEEGQDAPMVAVTGSRSPDTHRIYQRDFAAFSAWCVEHDVDPLPACAETVAAYLGERARTDRPATLARRVASIARAHEDAGRDSPTRSFLVRSLLRSLRRQQSGLTARGAVAAPAAAESAEAGRSASVAPAAQDGARDRAQADQSDLLAMVEATPTNTLSGKRDRALLLLTFAAALRRGELSTLEYTQLHWVENGLEMRLSARGRAAVAELPAENAVAEGETPQATARVLVTRDPEGSPLCPVAALETWLQAANIQDGPVFRPITLSGRVQPRSMTGHAIAEIIKRAAVASGRDPRRFSVQSLRSGAASAAVASPATVGGMFLTAANRSEMSAAPAASQQTADAALLSSLLESADEGVLVLDRDFRYQYVNAHAERLLQHSRAELQGRILWEVFPATVGSSIGEVFQRSMQEREYAAHRYRSRYQPAWFEVRCVPYGGESGGLMVHLRDVTGELLPSGIAAAQNRGASDSHEITRAPWLTASTAQDLFEALPHVVWTTDSEGALLSMNRHWFRYTGVEQKDAEQLEWSSWYDRGGGSFTAAVAFRYTHEEDQPACWESARSGMLAGRPFEFRYRLRRYDGQYRWHLGRVIPVRNDDGQITGWLGTGTEIESLGK